MTLNLQMSNGNERYICKSNESPKKKKMYKLIFHIGRYLLRRFFIVLAFSHFITIPAFALDAVRYAVSRHADLMSHNDYFVEMLRLAIQKSGAKVTLVPVRNDLNKIRTFAELSDGNSIDVVWGGATKERESSMLPIRICILKGLMGWRIPLLVKKNSDLFANVQNLNDLRKFVAGQGFHWTDTQILLASGMKVERSYEVESLFRMLRADRFDYFPRSLMEIWNEVDEHREMDITIDTHIVIHYPAAFYFYVKKGNKELADMIQKGLEVAINDGSFDKLFYTFHKKNILKAGLETRRIIELNNPYLAPETPLARKELWFRIEDLKKIKN